ncbi:MAG: hypothetical protein ACKOKE_00100 [Actinomycetota bacterium]
MPGNPQKNPEKDFALLSQNNGYKRLTKCPLDTAFSVKAVFFAQFLHAGGRWEDFCQEAPFGFTSPNAPTHEDVLGSMALSILCGHTRYAHVNALRFDTVTPPMFGMRKVVSEDSARRNLKKLDQIGARRWQGKHLRATWERLLHETWILDIGP